MNMEDYNKIRMLYDLASENETSKELVNKLVYEKIQKLKSDIYNMEKMLKAYKNLEKEINK